MDVPAVVGRPARLMPETINSGAARILSTFLTGGRALMVVQCPDARVALATVTFADNGYVAAVLGVFFVASHRLGELASVIETAQAALGAPPA